MSKHRTKDNIQILSESKECKKYIENFYPNGNWITDKTYEIDHYCEGQNNWQDFYKGLGEMNQQNDVLVNDDDLKTL